MANKKMPQIPDDRQYWRVWGRRMVFMPLMGKSMLLRDGAIGLCAVALVGIGKFARDVAMQLWRGNRDAAMSGLEASAVGFGTSLFVAIFLVWWLIRDERVRRNEQMAAQVRRDALMAEAIKQAVKQGITEALPSTCIGGKNEQPEPIDNPK